ncbi:sensor histidine kinase [Hyalangium rubrum]|uniref:histidine kinase n=1 Tax=Hyalangium rubrum TaxID=3103134 RepID=A0ABU5GW26_9BACT|nr:ATP-binding protein [Hyalangium sp. s54d21]MDY7225375.1 ATP-binding protein [Hyalangium sp. s54d21]
MTIRGKVLLFSAVAFALTAVMGVALMRGTSLGRRFRDLSAQAYEQRFTLSQLRGESLVYLDALQLAQGAGRDTRALRAAQLRRIESHFARFRILAQQEEALEGVSREEEEEEFQELEQELLLWTEHSEARFRPLPVQLEPRESQPREAIDEFGRRVEPLLERALAREQEEVRRLVLSSERVVRSGRIAAVAVPLMSVGLMFALASTILVPLNRRLRSLLEGAERIGRGEFNSALPEGTRDELGTLARGFNQMARELEASNARLVQSARLAALGQTVASVGHEINNPLAYVINNLAYAHEEVRQGREPRSEQERQALLEALADAREGAERVRFIVQDLKSVTRTEDAGHGVADVAAVVRTVAKMAAHELRGRARLVSDCEGVPPVQGNATRLAQVFLNLVVNAAHAIAPGSPERNEIRVVARLSAPGRVTVDVQDTGAGIPPEILERIFEPFFTTKPVGEGTGLGLAVCRNIITAMGGTLSVESTPGHGTTFRLSLPTASAD